MHGKKILWATIGTFLLGAGLAAGGVMLYKKANPVETLDHTVFTVNESENNNQDNIPSKESTAKPQSDSTTEYKYKIDVTQTDPSNPANSLEAFKDNRVREFYQDRLLFEQLSNHIKLNPSILFNWSNQSSKVIDNIVINTADDTKEMNIGAIRMPRSTSKDINGRLYIDVTISDKNEPNLGQTKYSFILCGFKRDALAFLNFNDYTKRLSAALYNSAMYGSKIKLNNNNKKSNTEFILANVFYYRDYQNPLESNLTPVPPSFISHGKDSITLKTDVISGNDAIFFPKSLLEKQSISFSFWTEENDSLVYPLVIILICVSIPIAIELIVLFYVLVIKRRSKIDVY